MEKRLSPENRPAVEGNGIGGKRDGAAACGVKCASDGDGGVGDIDRSTAVHGAGERGGALTGGLADARGREAKVGRHVIGIGDGHIT